MIRYSLNCTKGHRFESWFRSAEAFETLLASGMVCCAICGSSEVEKGLMAPRIGSHTDGDTDDGIGEHPLSAPASPAEQALADIRKKIEKNSDYVGSDFVQEARRMHDGDAPERSIYGEAKLDEAKKLIEDGVPVMPLPFTPGRKTN